MSYMYVSVMLFRSIEYTGRKKAIDMNDGENIFKLHRQIVIRLSTLKTLG